MDAVLTRRWLSRVIAGDGCWEWAGAHTTAGYSETWDGKRMLYGHRVAYGLLVGPIPDGLTIDHLCRNHGCVNPAHMEAVTQRVNILRSTGMSARHAAKTHCLRGHPFDEANTHLDARGRRNCRACYRVRNVARYVAHPKVAKTHCPQGHAYDAVNTWTDKSGVRHCRACSRERAREVRRRVA